MQREANAMQRVSVNEWFGEAERVFDQLDPRLVFRQDDFDDIEAEENVGIIEHAQPGERAARDAAALLAANGFEGTAEVFARARFHFHENKRLAIAANDIDLAARSAAEVAIEDFVALAAEKTARQLFAARTALEMRGTIAPEEMFQPLEKHSSLALSTARAKAKSGCATGSNERR